MSAASPASQPHCCGPKQTPMTGTMMMCCACHMARMAPLWPQQTLAATGHKVVLGCMALLTGTDSHTPPGAVKLPRAAVQDAVGLHDLPQLCWAPPAGTSGWLWQTLLFQLLVISLRSIYSAFLPQAQVVWRNAAHRGAFLESAGALSAPWAWNHIRMCRRCALAVDSPAAGSHAEERSSSGQAAPAPTPIQLSAADVERLRRRRRRRRFAQKQVRHAERWRVASCSAPRHAWL